MVLIKSDWVFDQLEPAAMAHAAALMPRLLAKAGPMMRLLDVIVSTCKMLNPLH